ncbi:hypothetical protein Gogos_005413 [Gossypium gossypioides]|uniref:Uncharacterized protein n=1 Tax=Gossypium gossypioides TaxID=34282 RepID=A0A7J9CYU2_GOSGO|nr:hypothetical protein [Gossypium gossypioides]
MNLEVVKYCATVLFLGSPISPSSDDSKSSPEQPSPNMHTLSSSPTLEMFQISLADVGNSEHHCRISLLTHHTGGENADVSNLVQLDPFNMEYPSSLQVKWEELPKVVSTGSHVLKGKRKTESPAQNWT